MKPDGPDANAVLRRIHDGFVLIAVAQGTVLCALLLRVLPDAIGYVAGGVGLVGVAAGYVHAAGTVGDDRRLDAAHAHWAATIRNYGLCLGLSSAILISLAWLSRGAGA